MPFGREITVAVLTCSDTRSADPSTDTAGPAAAALAEARGWRVIVREIVPDDVAAISDAITRMADILGADLVLTVGGTGLGPRDVTPEATLAVADRSVPGIAEQIRSRSSAITSRAMLSRGVAAVRGRTLVVNLPGSEKAVRETMPFFADEVEHAVEMMSGRGH